jgi:hypothetical protein
VRSGLVGVSDQPAHVLMLPRTYLNFWLSDHLQESLGAFK